MMGYMKQMAMAKEAAYDEARDFLVEIGTLKECENHPGTYFDGDGDLEHAYKMANARITKGTTVLGRGETRRDFTDRLKEVYEDNSGLEGCQECEDHFGPD
jgi:hypothetical protein